VPTDDTAKENPAVPHIRTGPRVAAALAAAALVLPAAASAHVTLQPSTAPADGFTRLDVRVPNERDDAATVKVDVQLPPSFAFVSYEPRPGWKVTVKRVKLDDPIEVEGGFEVDEGIGQITWSGGRIGPGEFVDFGLSLRMPKGEAGDKLTFKALQTYDDGQVVRWIGPEDADEPAPIVTLTAAASGGGHGAPGTSGDTAVSSDDAAGAREPATNDGAAAPAENTAATVEDDGGSDGLAIAALAVAVLALIAGLAAFVTRRPKEAR
jgi:periplasmic copper chaperone A